MRLNKEVLGEMRIQPGGPAKLDERSTERVVSDLLGPRDHDGKDKQRKKVAERGPPGICGRTLVGTGAVMGQRHVFAPDLSPSHGRRGQGRDDQARHVRGQSTRMSCGVVQAALRCRAGSRLPVALPQGGLLSVQLTP